MNALGTILGLSLLLPPCSGRGAPDTVNELIARGREALEAGKPADAQKLFDEAAAKDKGTLRTRTWVLRSWMDQGRINDALDAIDAIAKGGEKGVVVDYLYGMAFARKARTYMDQNVAGGPVQMAIDDAVQFLERAVKADPELARDAFLPLAEVAWYGQRLEVGRIALSQFSAAKDDASRKAEADAHWEAARAALAQAVDLLLPNATDAAARDTLVRVHVDLGHTYVWRERFKEAELEYASALIGNPKLVDMGQVQRALGTERMLVALEAAVPQLAARPGAEAADVAALTWWLGWARLDQKQWAKADEAFSAAVAKAPQFVNAWHYIALARFQQKDFEGAYAAIQKHWAENPSDLVAAVSGDPEASLPLLDGLVGWCAEKQRNADAAFLSELATNAAPSDSRYWNNTGLFWRDAGEILAKSERAEDKALAQEDFEKSWKAYTKALALEPENPALLNDAAVILHYYLDRDLERAKEMYRKAVQRAKAELAKTDLKPEARDLYETALRDSTNNLAKLEKGEKRE